MKPRLLQSWNAQQGRCFFCDGETLFYGRLFAGESDLETRHGRQPGDNSLHARETQAVLATLARECDGGDRSCDG